jgi:hypothetical protein
MDDTDQAVDVLRRGTVQEKPHACAVGVLIGCGYPNRLPRGMKNFRMSGIQHPVSFLVSGWAMDAGAKYRYGVDYALPLSDHADFDQLLEAAERVGATEIYCTHGPQEFVGHLRAAGFNAHPITGRFQMRMF